MGRTHSLVPGTIRFSKQAPSREMKIIRTNRIVQTRTAKMQTQKVRENRRVATRGTPLKNLKKKSKTPGHHFTEEGRNRIHMTVIDREHISSFNDPQNEFAFVLRILLFTALSNTLSALYLCR